MDGQEQDQVGAAMPAIYRSHDNARPTVKGLRLSPGLTSSIRDRARQEGTTVHGALCAALVLASREVFAAWREIPLRIFSPINARPLLDAGESCGVFLGATTSEFDRQAIDFWDIARDARIVLRSSAFLVRHLLLHGSPKDGLHELNSFTQHLARSRALTGVILAPRIRAISS